MATINLKIPDELRDQYKVYCAVKRTTMRADLLQYIEKQVARKEKKL